jgi:predicted secreted protein
VVCLTLDWPTLAVFFAGWDLAALVVLGINLRASEGERGNVPTGEHDSPGPVK